MSSAQLQFSELVPNKSVKVEVNGTDVCVTRIGDEVFAIADTCSHAEASLTEGEVTDFKVECWLHSAEFDLRTGQVLTPPATANLEVFAVTRDGDTVTISSHVK